MKTPKVLTNKYVTTSLLILVGLFLGWLFFHSSGPGDRVHESELHQHSEAENTIWTCSMHPQIKMDKPGDCPICGMDLIPLVKSGTNIDMNAIEISESAMKLAEVQTSIVHKGGVSKDVLLYGKIEPNERLLQSQTAHVPGRIEKLFINTTGETIKKGQLIASIYSPELVSAQKELLEAMSMSDKYPAILESAREKLRNWKLSEQQIKQLESSSKVINTFKIYASTSGIISILKVNEGDYINKGAVLYDVVDLSSVWAVFDAYESDLPWISIHQNVEFTTQAIPGKTFVGKVSFIDPIIDPTTRTARVRVELSNNKMEMKPGYFINGVLRSTKNRAGNQLVIPQSAVLWTGVRSIVYLKLQNTDLPTFKMKEVTIGDAMNDAYVLLDGLSEGDEIVTNGAFSVDASAQLEGKPSMMNRTGEAHSVPHDMSKMSENNNSTHKSSDEMTPNMKMGKTEMSTIQVQGNCEMCQSRIEKAALSVAGVKNAKWSADTKLLELVFNPSQTSSNAIQKAVAVVGHDTEKYKATKEVYDKLPGCCKYR